MRKTNSNFCFVKSILDIFFVHFSLHQNTLECKKHTYFDIGCSTKDSHLLSKISNPFRVLRNQTKREKVICDPAAEVFCMCPHYALKIEYNTHNIVTIMLSAMATPGRGRGGNPEMSDNTRYRLRIFLYLLYISFIPYAFYHP